MTHPTGFGFGPLSLWSRVWPYLAAAAAGLVFGVAIFVAIVRWL